MLPHNICLVVVEHDDKLVAAMLGRKRAIKAGPTILVA
jgi:hypothetical protein